MSAQNEHAFLAYVNRQSRVRKSSAAVHERVGIVSVGALGADDILVVAAHQLYAVQCGLTVRIYLLLDADDHCAVDTDFPLTVTTRSSGSKDKI